MDSDRVQEQLSAAELAQNSTAPQLQRHVPCTLITSVEDTQTQMAMEKLFLKEMSEQGVS